MSGEGPPEPVFREPWEAQAFAMTVLLHERGLFTWGEWAQALGAQIASAEGAGALDAAALPACTGPSAALTATTRDPASTADIAAARDPASTADIAAERDPGSTADTVAERDPASTADTATARDPASRGDTAASAHARYPAAEKSYYQHWLAALEALVAAKGASSSDELTRYQRAWEHAAHRTPHGQPIDLQPQDLGR